MRLALALLASLLLAPALTAGAGCGGCPQAKVCASAQKAETKAPSACGGKTQAHQGFQAHTPAALRWERVSMSQASIVKIEVPAAERAELLRSLEKTFADELAARSMRIMAMRNRLWIRGTPVHADAIEALLRKRLEPAPAPQVKAEPRP